MVIFATVTIVTGAGRRRFLSGFLSGRASKRGERWRRRQAAAAAPRRSARFATS